MTTAAFAPARAPRWRWIAALWFAGAVFEASQSVILRHLEGKHLEEIALFATEVAAWLPWMVAAPFVVDLARRLPIHRARTARGIAVHLLAWAVISMAMGAWWAGLQVLFNPWDHAQPPGFWDTWRTTQFFQALNCLAAYGLILTLTYLVDARDKVARQAAETARLGAELAQAQLAALRRQMEPHFMFNTLNSIAGLVRDSRNDAAVNMIVGLSELLRRASDDSHRAQVALAEEVEYLERYVAIQKVRFGDRLQVTTDIPAGLGSAQVPYLLLQPLVENAILHGVSKRLAGGRVHIAARRDGDSLRLRVHNDGPSPAEGASARGGVGLSNLKTRLQILHGGASELRLAEAEEGGVEVVVTLPYAEA